MFYDPFYLIASDLCLAELKSTQVSGEGGSLRTKLPEGLACTWIGKTNR